jgi:GMP synthase-like glutamine amidotransferase
MKPVLILQHLSTDGPAYLARWLAEQGVPFDVLNADAGELPPATLQNHGALAILGGEMSANDDLPALRAAEELFRLAVRDGVPTLGHCLGGQLMARALGARVAPAAAPEIGWHALQTLPQTLARDWFGDAPDHTVFQWHYDSFRLPPGATLLARSDACAHQAFAIGPHLAMQFHVELDEDKLNRWSREDGLQVVAAAGHASVQGGPAMRADAALHLAAQQALAARIYSRWLALAGAR